MDIDGLWRFHDGAVKMFEGLRVRWLAFLREKFLQIGDFDNMASVFPQNCISEKYFPAI
jgi:hypothetical protein